MRKISTGRIILFLTLLVVLWAGFYFGTNGYLNRILKARIESEFTKQTDAKYELKIETIKSSLVKRSLSFRNLSVRPIKDSLKEATFNLSCAEIRFSGVNIIRYLTAKELVIDRLYITDPRVSVIKGTRSKRSDSDSLKEFSLFNVIKQFAKSLTIKRFVVNNSQFEYFNTRADTIASLSSNDNYFKVVNLYIGPSSKHNPGYFKADTVSFVMNRVAWTTTDSLYSMKAKKIEVSYRDSALVIDSIGIEPNYTKRRFAEIAGKQTDRFDISLGRLVFEKIDLRRFIEYHDIISQSLSVVNLTFKAFRDKNDPREFKRPASVQQLIHQIPFYCSIDTIKLLDSFIAYEEMALGKKVPGRITFNQINGNFTGLTNDSLLISTGRVLRFSANCLLMNEGKLNAIYLIPLNTTNMVFECKGFMTKLPMAALNSMLEPAVGISLDKGVIDTLDFSFKAGENSSSGKMKLIYHDLHLSMPETKDASFKEKLGLLIANNFIIKENNPQGNKQPDIANLFFERNKERFMFHYTWKTLFSGIKSTVGLPDTKKK